jgi:hypothetical protein
LLVAGYIAWSQVGSSPVEHSYFGLQEDQIELTPRPPWIKSDIVSAVFEKSQLADVSKLDHRAGATLANAFNLHPWIKRTIRVQKMSDKILVDVEYREPVALVYVENENVDGTTKTGFYPIDREAIKLPMKDFTRDDVLNYFLIYAPDVRNKNNVEGIVLSDSRVVEAAKLANLLKPIREPLGLQRINVYKDSDLYGRSAWIFEIQTPATDNQESRRILWGHGLAAEVPGEANASEKIDLMTASIRRATDSVAEIDTPVLYLYRPSGKNSID